MVCVLVCSFGKVKVAFGNEPGHEKTKMEQSADVLYCDKGGTLTCCYTNEKCINNFDTINDKVNKMNNASKTLFNLFSKSHFFIFADAEEITLFSETYKEVSE